MKKYFANSVFAGLFTALHLSQQNYSHPIILIEQRDRFSFKPLLYELLSGELHSEQAITVRKHLRRTDYSRLIERMA
ncbi:MAG: hypothetical protein ACYTXT_41190 [Nostoc sp.]